MARVKSSMRLAHGLVKQSDFVYEGMREAESSLRAWLKDGARRVERVRKRWWRRCRERMNGGCGSRKRASRPFFYRQA